MERVTLASQLVPPAGFAGTAPFTAEATGAGAALMRTDTPIPTSNSREYVGPLVEAGYEHTVFGSVVLSLTVQYDVIVSNGPTMLTGVLGVGLQL